MQISHTGPVVSQIEPSVEASSRTQRRALRWAYTAVRILLGLASAC